MLDYKILEILEKKDGILTNKKISEKLNTTPSKIRSRIGYLEKRLDRDIAEIEKKRGQGNGYSLTIYDEEKYREFLEKMKQEEQEEENSMNHSSSRIETIVLKLLNSDAPIKSELLAEELVVSPRQLNNDLRMVRQLLDEYSLTIVNRPYYGMHVEGDEFNKRLCLANLYMKNTTVSGDRIGKTIFDNIENDNMVKRIRAIVLEESARYHIQFSDIALNNLVIHLFVIIKRSVNFKSEQTEELKGVDEKEKSLTEAIISRIEKEFSARLNPYDFQCLEIHIAGKRAYLDDDVSLIPESIKNFTTGVLCLIDDIYKTHFQQDEGLAMRLQLHFAPLLIRMENHMTLKNPMLEEVKSKYVLSYEIALLVGTEIEKCYHMNLAEDELAYIALHFEMSLYQSNLKRYKVLLICHTGICSAEILKQQILGKFYNYVSRLDTCGVNQVGNVDLEQYSFIFTTIPLKLFTGTPVYEIEDFLDDKSARFMSRIFERGDFTEDLIRKYFPKELFCGVMEANTKEEVISKMTKVVREHRPVSEHFLEDIMKREKASCTDYGNSIAIPHPIHMSEDGLTYTSVAVLKKPIRWKKNMVRVVFLNNISKGGENLQHYYYLLSSFTTSEEKVNALVKNPEYENLVRLLVEK
jgi:lichenan operon transcriptional antiterminator